VDYYREIIHNVDSDTLLAAPEKPEPPLLANSAEFSLIGVVAIKAPYRLPAHVDFHRLRLIAAARCSSAEDYIYNIREDPGYFTNFVKE
jgi:hypothetical protein